MSWGSDWEDDEKAAPIKKSANVAVIEGVPKEPEAESEVDLTGANLDQLAHEANKWHAQAVGNALEAAWHAGTALNAAKAQLTKHGQVTMWLEANFDGSRQTAYDYMRIADAGDSPEVVVNLTTNADGTPMLHPSINAALRSIAKKKKKKPKPPKSSTKLNRWLKKLDTVAEEARGQMHRNLGHLTVAEAQKIAVRMRDAIDDVEEIYSAVGDLADEPAPWTPEEDES